MRILTALLLTAAGTALAACTSDDAGRAAEAIVSPVTAPVNALVNSTAPLPQDAQYTYWRRKAGTNLFEPYVTDHPLTTEEQQALGIVPSGK